MIVVLIVTRKRGFALSCLRVLEAGGGRVNRTLSGSLVKARAGGPGQFRTCTGTAAYSDLRERRPRRRGSENKALIRVRGSVITTITSWRISEAMPRPWAAPREASEASFLRLASSPFTESGRLTSGGGGGGGQPDIFSVPPCSNYITRVASPNERLLPSPTGICVSVSQQPTCRFTRFRVN